MWVKIPHIKIQFALKRVAPISFAERNVAYRNKRPDAIDCNLADGRLLSKVNYRLSA